jgi:hypothetical protein
VVSQAEGVGEVLHRQGVLGHAGHRREARHLAQAEDEVVVGVAHELQALALGDEDPLVREVDAPDRAAAEERPGDELADRVDDVGGGDAPRGDLGQEGWKTK